MSKRLLLVLALVSVLVFSAGMFAYTYTSDARLISAVPVGEDFARAEPTPTQPNWNSLLPSGSGTVIVRPSGIGDDTEIQVQNPGSGAHWDKMDDVNPDEDTTHVRATSNAYRRDLYQLSDVVIDMGVITRVAVYFRFAGSTTGYAKAAIQTYGRVYEGAEYSQDGHTYITQLEIWTVNPFTDAAWTREEINELQAGVSLKGQGNNPTYATQVYVEVSYRARTYGDTPIGSLFQVTVSNTYTGDQVVNLYLTNVGNLNKAYQYLNLKLALTGAAESSQLLTLQNGMVSFNLDGPAGGVHTLSVTGGSFGLVSGNSVTWRPGWTLVPELFIEVLQK